MLDENQSDTYFLYGDILAGNKNVEKLSKCLRHLMMCKLYHASYQVGSNIL